MLYVAFKPRSDYMLSLLKRIRILFN